VHAYFSRSCVKIEGFLKRYSRSADSGRIIEAHFCPDCGSTMFWGLRYTSTGSVFPLVRSLPTLSPDVSIFMPYKHP
jgi:hypothetical protein